MRRSIAAIVPSRYLPLAALAAGRPDAAALHLAGHGEVASVGVDGVRREVDQLRNDVAQLRQELSVAIETIERLRHDAVNAP